MNKELLVSEFIIGFTTIICVSFLCLTLIEIERIRGRNKKK